MPTVIIHNLTYQFRYNTILHVKETQHGNMGIKVDKVDVG